MEERIDSESQEEREARLKGSQEYRRLRVMVDALGWINVQDMLGMIERELLLVKPEHLVNLRKRQALGLE